jgi:UDPglucose--hexose-1-phosphate uridylyltransferase
MPDPEPERGVDMSSRQRNLQPHRRYNPLNGNWVLVSPQRALRPWQGSEETSSPPPATSHDPECYLCPGNVRASGLSNPQYPLTYAFTNDFSALGTDAQAATASKDTNSTATSNGLLRTAAVRGTSRVLCYSPHHDLTLASMSQTEIAQVITLWIEQSAELGRDYRWVQVFENKGELMGCSNPHPHGQVWAQDTLPTDADAEDRNQREHYRQFGTPLLADYAAQELALGERVVAQTEHWLLLVPYWAQWPFETLLLPRQPIARLPELSNAVQQDLAAMLQQLLQCYDSLFNCPFPYSMGWHGAPFDDNDSRPWLLHAHFYPPLLRSASVKKFMVGYELLGEAQRDFTPEYAAQRLREAAQRAGAARKG